MRYLEIQNLNIAKFVLFTSLIISSGVSLKASHIRAGEIIARRIDISSRTFEFVFIGYRDDDTDARFGTGIFDLGDGTTITNNFLVREERISSNVVRAEFVIPHSYAAPGTYSISYR